MHQGEVRLDAVRNQPLDVLQVEVRRRVDNHVSHGMHHLRGGNVRTDEAVVERVQCG